MFVFEWLNNQLLKMEWLNYLVAQLVGNVFGLDTQSQLGGRYWEQSHHFVPVHRFLFLSVLPVLAYSLGLPFHF